MDNDDVPGLAAVLVNRGGVLWQGAFGHYPDDADRGIATNTIFSIQSISKNYTAVAIMLPVQEAKLGLDIPIKEYLPDLKINTPFPEDPTEIIALRHLLSHTAGFTHGENGRDGHSELGDILAGVISHSNGYEGLCAESLNADEKLPSAAPSLQSQPERPGKKQTIRRIGFRLARADRLWVSWNLLLESPGTPWEPLNPLTLYRGAKAISNPRYDPCAGSQ